MTTRIVTQEPYTPIQTAARKVSVQRKCACGGTPGPTGECAECRRKRLLRQPVQTKLTVNEPGDRYEREADRVASGASLPAITPVRLTRVRRHTEDATERRAYDIDRQVDGVRSGGVPMPTDARRFYESRFGHDFSRVRIHTDAAAAAEAQALNAQAFTVGTDIVFGAGRFQPQTTQGQRLLAHELTHVVQQTSGAPAIQRAVCADLGEYTRRTNVARSGLGGLPTYCDRVNARDCCAPLGGCDRSEAARQALSGSNRARAKLQTAITEMRKPVLSRPVRRAFVELFGRRQRLRRKDEVLNNLEEAFARMQAATVPARSSDAASRVREQQPAVEPSEEPAFALAAPASTELEPAPLEPPSQSPTPAAPQIAVPPQPIHGMPGPPGSAPVPAAPVAERPAPCPPKKNAIKCAEDCAAGCSADTLAFYRDGEVYLCVDWFGLAEPAQDLILIHEFLHAVISGDYDVYAFSRLFRVLPKLEDGGVALKNPESYATLVMAASGVSVADVVRLREGPGRPEFEGFVLRPGQRDTAEIALALADGGIRAAAHAVEALHNDIVGLSPNRWDQLRLDTRRTLAELRGDFVVTDEVFRCRDTGSTRFKAIADGRCPWSSAGTGKDGPQPKDKDEIERIKETLNVMKKQVGVIFDIQRVTTGPPARYTWRERPNPFTLQLSRDFFKLANEQAQVEAIVRAFATSAGISPALLPAYAAFVELSANRPAPVG